MSGRPRLFGRGRATRYFESEPGRSNGANFRQKFGNPNRGRGRGYGSARGSGRGGGRSFHRAPDAQAFLPERGGGRSRDRRDSLHGDRPNRLFDDTFRNGLGHSARAPAGDVWDDDGPTPHRLDGAINDARFSGSKRDRSHIPEPDVNLTSRRPRKYVPGGRIGKYVKVQEYGAELYCEACERNFPDPNGKSLHDRSIDHRRKMEFLRKEEDRLYAAEYEEMEVEHLDGKEPGSSTEQPEGNQKVANFTATEVGRFFQKNKTHFTPEFKDWANRSLNAAREEAKRTGDPVLMQSVEKEVIADFMYFTDECLMRTESWGRRPLASGANYRGVAVARFQDHVIPEDKVHKKASVFTQEDDVIDITDAHIGNRRWERGGLENIPEGEDFFEEKTDPSSAAKEDEVKAAAAPDFEIVEEKEDKNKGLADKRQDVKPLQVTWKMRGSGSAMLRYNACLSNKRDEILRKTQKFAGRTGTSQISDGLDDGGSEPLIQKYRELRRQFDAAEYDYDEWHSATGALFAKLEGRGTRIGTLQSCLEMQVCAAIDCERWEHCFPVSNKLMGMYQAERNKKWMERGSQYVGFWLLSLLFKFVDGHAVDKRTQRGSKSAKSRTSLGSRIFFVNSRMRELPIRALHDINVHYSLQVFNAVVSNNYCKFFQLYKEGEHYRRPTRSQYIMEELIDVVRERALVSMSMVSCLREYGVFQRPPQLEHIMKVLGWDKPPDQEGVDNELVNVRKFITDLPQRIAVAGDKVHGRSAALAVTNEKAVIQARTVVDVETIVALSGKAWRLKAFSESQQSLV